MQDYILVIDIGSSSTRALLYDRDAQLVSGAIARREFSFDFGADGKSEDDPAAAFARVCEVIDELMASQLVRDVKITAIGISAYASSLLCLDNRGLPLTPVSTYADTRFTNDARMLRGEVDEFAVLQRTGCRTRANYVPARIAWLKRTQPRVFSMTHWFVTLSDYICLRLFGVMRAGVSLWSWSGLLNRRTLAWDSEWLNHLGVRVEQLPSLAHRDECLGPLLPEFASRWPKLSDVRCLPAVGDGAAANIGSGCIDDQRIALTIGTTAAMRIVNSGPIAELPAALWGYRVDHMRELIGGATTEGGSVFHWLRKTLQLPEPAILEQAIAESPPDGHKLTILPMFAGERSPGYSEDSKATLHGLSLETDPIQIARACLEAIAYRLCAIYDELQTAAKPGAPLIASGGALMASPAWCQILADVTGTIVHICTEEEATSRGIAMLTLENLGAGVLNQYAAATHFGRRFQPDAQRREIYRAAMARQRTLYDLLV
jgi:gluconokinase